MALGLAAGELTPVIHDSTRGKAAGGSRVSQLAFVGAGPAGLTAAVAAASAGLHVDVFERAERLAVPQAAHWDLHPEATTGLPILAQRLTPIVERAA